MLNNPVSQFMNTVLGFSTQLVGSVLMQSAFVVMMYPELSDAVLVVCKNAFCRNTFFHGGVNTHGRDGYPPAYCADLNGTNVWHCWFR